VPSKGTAGKTPMHYLNVSSSKKMHVHHITLKSELIFTLKSDPLPGDQLPITR
jgi:hypothetical protein